MVTFTWSWSREPVNGGCRYLSETGEAVTGNYPTHLFESDCRDWRASNLPGYWFRTPKAAMAASQYAEEGR